MTAFTPFGEISDVKVMKDPLSNKPKGYGFVSFLQKEDAMNAIEQMNGQWMGSRSIRTNWATRQGKPGTGGVPYGGKALNYDEVFRQSSATNTTVYIGGTTSSDEIVIREAFKLYGKIVEVRYFKDKGYAFVRYDNKESAASAIVACHLTEVGGQTIKWSWAVPPDLNLRLRNVPTILIMMRTTDKVISSGATIMQTKVDITKEVQVMEGIITPKIIMANNNNSSKILAITRVVLKEVMAADTANKVEVDMANREVAAEDTASRAVTDNKAAMEDTASRAVTDNKAAME